MESLTSSGSPWTTRTRVLLSPSSITSSSAPALSMRSAWSDSAAALKSSDGSVPNVDGAGTTSGVTTSAGAIELETPDAETFLSAALCDVPGAAGRGGSGRNVAFTARWAELTQVRPRRITTQATPSTATDRAHLE